jgi:hypothetical protein
MIAPHVSVDLSRPPALLGRWRGNLPPIDATPA